MDQYIDNNLEGCNIGGNYTGGNTYNITLYQDTEREFVVTHNADIKPTAYFTGRETELEDLHQRIEEGRKSVLISGMGGIGKTHICRKLFEEYFNKHTNGEDIYFRHIGYIEYDRDMDSSLQRCLKYKEQENLEQNREAAWRELEYLASDGKLLLFIDNVDRPIGEDSGLQRLKGIPGAVVLTSRQASFSDEFEPYRIGFLGMGQCKEIYGKIRFEGSDRKVDLEEVEDLEYIIENLVGRHTITIEILAHLARTKHWSVKRLREELEQKGFRLTFHKDGVLVNIQESYEKLYNLSELTEAEQNILEAFSVFPYIPMAAETCNEWLLADAGVSEDDDVLMGLYQKGWLQFNLDQEAYVMHPVFAQFIYEKCKPRMKNHYGLIEACEKSLKIPKSGVTLECQKYIPFAESIVEKIAKEDIELIDVLAYLFAYIAEYQKAQKLCEESLKICKRVWGEEHPYTARSYNSLAYIYDKLGKYKKAKELFRKSLETKKKVLGEEHPDTARGYHNLAHICDKLEEYEKARELYEKSLEICKKVLGEENLDTASSYNNLAGVYNNLGEYEKAKKLYKKSIEINEKVLGEEHPDTVINYNNLAYVCNSLGEYKIAVDYYIKAYKVFLFKLGLNHPYTKSVYENIEITYNEWNPEGDFKQWIEERMKL